MTIASLLFVATGFGMFLGKLTFVPLSSPSNDVYREQGKERSLRFPFLLQLRRLPRIPFALHLVGK